jgi:hypothetical protein
LCRHGPSASRKHKHAPPPLQCNARGAGWHECDVRAALSAALSVCGRRLVRERRLSSHQRVSGVAVQCRGGQGRSGGKRPMGERNTLEARVRRADVRRADAQRNRIRSHGESWGTGTSCDRQSVRHAPRRTTLQPTLRASTGTALVCRLSALKALGLVVRTGRLRI